MTECNPKPDTYAIQLINAKEVPVWGNAIKRADTYIHASVTQYNPQTASEHLIRYNIPLANLLGGSDVMGEATVAKNGSAITLVDRQVVPAYVSRNQPHTVNAADGSHKAQFLITGENVNDSDQFNIKNSGVYIFPEGHDYNVGYDYYMNEKGEVTTDAGTAEAPNQHLFVAINTQTILINLGL